MEYFLSDSISILSSNDISELENREFLISDNIDDGIEEQISIEFTFYNQLFTLLISYLENYFGDLIIIDITTLIEEIKESFKTNEIKKNILKMFEDELFKSIINTRRIDKMKFIFDLLNYEDKSRSQTFQKINFLFTLRDCIIYNKGYLKKSKIKDINNFNININDFELKNLFKKESIKFDFILMKIILKKVRIIILEIDKFIAIKINAFHNQKK